MVTPGLTHCGVVFFSMNWKRRREKDGMKKADEKGGMNRLFHCLLHDVTSLPKLPVPVSLWVQAPREGHYPWAVLGQPCLAWEAEVTVLP